MSITKKIKMPSACWVKEVECFYRSGYDNHDYTVLHDAESGEYLGELKDISPTNSRIVQEILKVLGCNV